MINDDGVLDHGLEYFLRTGHRVVVGSVGWLCPPLVRVPGVGQPQVAIGQSQAEGISLHGLITKMCITQDKFEIGTGLGRSSKEQNQSNHSFL